jgi:uncharacterized protein YehS (DUF1456 family)
VGEESLHVILSGNVPAPTAFTLSLADSSHQDLLMTHNDILRRIRYILELDDSKVIAIFALAGLEVTRAQISDWLKKDEDPAYQHLSDPEFATFLNGLIVEKRGRRDGPQPMPEQTLNNNIVFMKLKIAFNLKAEDTLALLALNDMEISKHELSAFFRKPGHKHFRACKDQILRNFLKGLQVKYRGQNKTGESCENDE